MTEAAPVETFDRASAARALYGPKPALEVPADVQALRSTESVSLYDNTPHRDVQSMVMPKHGEDMAGAKAEALELTRIGKDIGASEDEVSTLVSALKRHATPVSSEELASLNARADAAVDREFGKDAPQVLALASKLVQRDPRLKALLQRSNAICEPDVIITLCKLAKQQHARGRLAA